MSDGEDVLPKILLWAFGALVQAEYACAPDIVRRLDDGFAEIGRSDDEFVRGSPSLFTNSPRTAKY
jgi:hypothetical protein